MSGTPYPGLESVGDPMVKRVLKALFDKVGNLETQVPAIGTVSQPLTTHLNANRNQLQAVGDPTHPQDAVTLTYLQHYVESRVTTVVAAATATTVSPPSDGPVIPSPPPVGPTPPVVPFPPATGGTFSATDMLNLNTVSIQSSPPDIASWPQTATLTLFDWQSSGVLLTFDKQATWPPYTPPGWTGPLQSTLWLFLKISGQWYGAGFIQFWAAAQRNGGPPSQLAQNWNYDVGRWAQMAGYQPAVGEQVGFMVSAGNARAGTPGGSTGVTSVKERSQTILISMPSDAGTIYT